MHFVYLMSKNPSLNPRMCVFQDKSYVVKFLIWNSRSENFPHVLLNFESFITTFV